MSPVNRGEITHVESFPRVSGDEPIAPKSEEGPHQFSPRERG